MDQEMFDLEMTIQPLRHKKLLGKINKKEQAELKRLCDIREAMIAKARVDTTGER